jgi:glyoxylase-like metal-dependent hydrolase (beta-lactamase superfamily II)
MHEWFAVQAVAPDVWLIAEPGHVNSWLVRGRDRAILIDTGLGIAPIRSLAETLAGVPISVVNTHAHFDHVGGNREFSDIAIHELGMARLRQGVPTHVLTAYLAYTRELIAASELYRDLDRRYFFLLEDASDPRPLPTGFSGEDWRIGPSEATHAFHEGDRIDLGGRTLSVLYTPGHAPDCICLLDEEAGILFGGDTINTGPIYAHLADSDVAAFTASTARLASLAAGLRMVCVSHFGRAVSPPTLLAEIADGFARIGEGSAPLEPSQDALNRPVLEARFTRFSILLRTPGPVAGP